MVDGPVDPAAKTAPKKRTPRKAVTTKKAKAATAKRTARKAAAKTAVAKKATRLTADQRKAKAQAREAEQLAQAVEAFALRRAGADYRAIGSALNIDPKTAWRAVQRAKDLIIEDLKEEVADQIVLDLARADEIIRQFWPGTRRRIVTDHIVEMVVGEDGVARKAEKDIEHEQAPDRFSAKVVLDAMDFRMKVLGGYAPTRQDLHLTEGDDVDQGDAREELARRLASIETRVKAADNIIPLKAADKGKG